MDAKKEVTLGGRVFVPTEEDDMTFDQFAWIQTAAEKAGLGQELMGAVEPIVRLAGQDVVHALYISRITTVKPHNEDRDTVLRASGASRRVGRSSCREGADVVPGAG